MKMQQKKMMGKKRIRNSGFKFYDKDGNASSVWRNGKWYCLRDRDCTIGREGPKGHLLRYHLPKKDWPHVCPECNERFQWPKRLNFHYRNTH